jgi:hypothetical protein
MISNLAHSGRSLGPYLVQVVPVHAIERHARVRHAASVHLPNPQALPTSSTPSVPSKAGSNLPRHHGPSSPDHTYLSRLAHARRTLALKPWGVFGSGCIGREGLLGCPSALWTALMSAPPADRRRWRRLCSSSPHRSAMVTRFRRPNASVHCQELG